MFFCCVRVKLDLLCEGNKWSEEDGWYQEPFRLPLLSCMRGIYSCSLTLFQKRAKFHIILNSGSDVLHTVTSRWLWFCCLFWSVLPPGVLCVHLGKYTFSGWEAGTPTISIKNKQKIPLAKRSWLFHILLVRNRSGVITIAPTQP